MKKLTILVGIIMIFLSVGTKAQCTVDDEYKFIMLGDSWQDLSQNLHGTYDKMLSTIGFPYTKVISANTAISGSEAGHWADTVGHDYLFKFKNDLLNNPSITEGSPIPCHVSPYPLDIDILTGKFK